MSDEVSRILNEHTASPVPSALDAPPALEVSPVLEASPGPGVPSDLDPGVDIDESQFDEDGYLRLHPDVAEAIRRGDVASGYLHYVIFGYREGRATAGASVEPRNRLIVTANSAVTPATQTIRHNYDSVCISQGGGLLVIGWLDDVTDPVETLRIASAQWRVVIDGAQLVRVRRSDVEQALEGRDGVHPYGFFGFLFFDAPLQSAGPCTMELRLRSGATAQLDVAPRHIDDIEIRNTVLTYLTTARYFGNSHVESIANLDNGLGQEVVKLNRAITSRVVASPYVERFGRAGRKPRASLIVCLYGKAEFQFVQSCLYAGLPGMDEYEFVFVSNSPELAEVLLREAHSVNRIYGVDQTVVVLPGNAGFGGANNAAVSAALSKRVIALNPDVFPHDQDWGRKHLDLLDGLPQAQTRLFGTPLYYDDGSLMHGGMYFEVDTGLSISGGVPRHCPMVRVEHYGKGAPAWSQTYLQPRPVPAVTGAFISVERSWFEQLGGFTENYVFGHYEDADLCLKSLERGVPSWFHDLKMWHLEGKGSTRLPPHEGGSLVNRWLFSKTWSTTLQAGLLGPAPAHPLLAPPAAPAPIAPVPIVPEPIVPEPMAPRLAKPRPRPSRAP